MKLDSIEDIKKCLSCQKLECNNCLKHVGERPKMGRPRKAVIRIRNGKTEYFECLSIAAESMGCSAYHIRTAINSGKSFCGYKWRFA